jgi:pimeloyl-ACP methyl ester carboxylesterase
MEEKYVSVSGIRTRYLEAGSGDPIVLVHGGEFGRFANANDWEPIIAPLAEEGFHVLALDKIGNGFSDHPPPDALKIEKTVDHLRGFIKTLGLGPSHLVGHSRGGYTVTKLALDDPGVVRTLVIVSSATTLARFNPIYEKWNQEAAKINDPRERVRHQLVSNSFSSAHVTESLIDVVLGINQLPETQKTSRVMVAGARAEFLADIASKQESLLRSIREGKLKSPTLVTWGLNDPSSTFEPVGISAIDLFLKNAPKAEAHVFGQAGHYVYREQPLGFVRVLRDFVRRVHSAE